jgi:hypothetical protein
VPIHQTRQSKALKGQGQGSLAGSLRFVTFVFLLMSIFYVPAALKHAMAGDGSWDGIGTFLAARG